MVAWPDAWRCQMHLIVYRKISEPTETHKLSVIFSSTVEKM